MLSADNSSDNTANPYCLTWHYGAAITGWGCGPEQQEGSIVSPDLTPWYPPTIGVPAALLTEASITLVQGPPTFFPSSTTSASEEASRLAPTTVLLATSTQFPFPSTTTRADSAKLGVNASISIVALLIIVVVALM